MLLFYLIIITAILQTQQTKVTVIQVYAPTETAKKINSTANCKTNYKRDPKLRHKAVDKRLQRAD